MKVDLDAAWMDAVPFGEDPLPFLFGRLCCRSRQRLTVHPARDWEAGNPTKRRGEVH